MSINMYIKNLSIALIIFTFVNSFGVYFVNILLTGGGGLPREGSILLQNISFYVIKSFSIGIFYIFFINRSNKDIMVESINIKLLLIFSILVSTFFLKNVDVISISITKLIYFNKNISIRFSYIIKIISTLVILITVYHLYIIRNREKFLKSNLHNVNYIFLCSSTLSISFMLSKIPLCLNLYRSYMHHPLVFLNDYSLISSILGVLFVYACIILLFNFFSLSLNITMSDDSPDQVNLILLIVSISIIFPYFFMYLSDVFSSLIDMLHANTTVISRHNMLTPFRLRNLLISITAIVSSYILTKRAHSKTNDIKG